MLDKKKPTTAELVEKFISTAQDEKLTKEFNSRVKLLITLTVNQAYIEAKGDYLPIEDNDALDYEISDLGDSFEIEISGLGEYDNVLRQQFDKIKSSFENNQVDSVKIITNKFLHKNNDTSLLFNILK